MNDAHDPARAMRFAAALRLDLNLFRVFAAIYREQHLTRAADRLCVSQSAVSHALARLRTQLDDPLFVRDQQRMRPTPLAQRIWPQVDQALSALEQVSARESCFEPSRDARALTLSVHDAVEALLLPDWYARLCLQAPALQLHSVRLDREHMLAELRSGRLDLAVDVAQATAAELRHTCCFRDDWVMLCGSANAPVDEQAYLHHPHVVVSSRRTGRSLEDLQLSRQGLSRQVVLRCQDYQTAVAMVSHASAQHPALILTAPRQLVSRLPLPCTVQILPLPVPLDPVELHLYWHQHREQDPLIQWARQQLIG